MNLSAIYDNINNALIEKTYLQYKECFIGLPGR